ncbi:hypothetical protein TNCT_312991 [Trichonephila clavata]|uniref:Uncharacterized protein n=1 Tax=Trichonephila clavata TaxID=2740835 RepID=A0A8X6H6I6_TRICU|nr:hypothetical protein TNCT_312991 [Trichonephila clavata]
MVHLFSGQTASDTYTTPNTQKGWKIDCGGRQKSCLMTGRHPCLLSPGLWRGINGRRCYWAVESKIWGIKDACKYKFSEASLDIGTRCWNCDVLFKMAKLG